MTWLEVVLDPVELPRGAECSSHSEDKSRVKNEAQPKDSLQSRYLPRPGELPWPRDSLRLGDLSQQAVSPRSVVPIQPVVLMQPTNPWRQVGPGIFDRTQVRNRVCVFLQSLDLPDNVLYPNTPTHSDIYSWFKGGVPLNLIACAMASSNTSCMKMGDCKYIPAETGPFCTPWPDTFNDTLQRQALAFLVHHGNVKAYCPKSYNSAISSELIENFTVNNKANPDHWTSTTPLFYQNPIHWVDYIGQQLKRIDDEARSGMIDVAQEVWFSIDTSSWDVWYHHACTPGRLTQIMLYWIRSWSDSGGLIKWLIGKPLRNHFNVDVLYRPDFELQMCNPHLGINFDLVSVLKNHLELSCAHMLAEVFKCYCIGDGSPHFVNVLTENFGFLSPKSPDQALLFGGIGKFPYIPVPSGKKWIFDNRSGSFSYWSDGV